jgi:high-affinity iron transporter
MNVAILVFREGLECVLVLAAITASLTGPRRRYQWPITLGVVIAIGVTVVTWRIAAGIIDDLSERISALNVQAATGLLAVCVLLVVMNWFFHKVYWTGWISLHTDRKRALLAEAERGQATNMRLFLGFALLGFTSLYREGVEVVLFLQSYRLKFGSVAAASGLWFGLALTAVVAVLTFVAHRRLPYRRMLVATGVLLGVVLLVMVGEQAQEMQLAHWLPVTPIRGLDTRIPDWLGTWFSIFPTVETLAAQALALVLVLGSYFLAQRGFEQRAPIHASRPA